MKRITLLIASLTLLFTTTGLCSPKVSISEGRFGTKIHTPEKKETTSDIVDRITGEGNKRPNKARSRVHIYNANVSTDSFLEQFAYKRLDDIGVTWYCIEGLHFPLTSGEMGLDIVYGDNFSENRPTFRVKGEFRNVEVLIDFMLYTQYDDERTRSYSSINDYLVSEFSNIVATNNEIKCADIEIKVKGLDLSRKKRVAFIDTDEILHLFTNGWENFYLRIRASNANYLGEIDFYEYCSGDHL